MWGFAWMFWMVPLFFYLMFMRRRRWDRWQMRQGGYGPTREGPGTQRELDGQRSYIDALETRVSQLEERLDFTERLVSGRREG